MHLMNLEFVATGSEHVDVPVVRVQQSPTFQVVHHENISLCGFMIAFVLLCECFRDDLVYGLMSSGPLALGIAPDFARNSAQAMEFKGSYYKLTARKIVPLGVLENFEVHVYLTLLPPDACCSNVFNVIRLFQFEPDDAKCYSPDSWTNLSKGEGPDAA